MLLSLDNATKMFAEKIIFMGASLKIEEGDRIGLVGVNGAGKSTLLNVLEGSLPLEQGERAARSGLSLGFLRQDSGLDGQNTIWEEMRGVFRPLLDAQAKAGRIAAQMGQYTDRSSPDYLALSEEYNRLQSYFEVNEGYNIDVKIRTILNGMGFADKDADTPCDTLSGGEKTRLALARLLLSDPELLMLDEPTNHLDFATLQWLETYLQSYRGAIVVVSHDRYFLDQLCTRIWEVAHLRVTPYKGNYTRYMHTREMLYERQLKEYEMYQQRVTKLSDFVARNKVRASTAALARSREKEIERMEPVKQPPKPLNPARISFFFERDPVKDVLHVEGLSLRAGGGPSGRLLCSDVSFDLLRGEKVALVGSNGVGKSTFLKTLIGQLKPEAGRIQWGRNVKVSYFEQGQVGLTGFKTVLEELWDRYPQSHEQDLRNLLGGLLFSGETIYKRVDMLSGGEKARLKFAIMMYEEGNVLLLDEPTNHLDLATREALDRALVAYEGTILAVSHDRYLLSRMPGRIVEMHPDGFVSYRGNYEDYLAQRSAAGAAQAAPQPAEGPAGPEAAAGSGKSATEYHRTKKQRAEAAARKKRLFEVEQEISDLEAAIQLEQEKLSDPEISRDYQKVTELCANIDRLRVSLSERMDEWAGLSE